MFNQPIEVECLAIGLVNVERWALGRILAKGYAPAVGLDAHLSVTLAEAGYGLNADVFPSFCHIVAAVVLAREPRICRNHIVGHAKALVENFLEWLQRLLLRFIARKNLECKRYPVVIHKHTHLHYGVRTMLLRFAILTQALNKLTCLRVYHVRVIVLYLEVIISAVVKHHLVAARQYVQRVSVDLGLYHVDVPRQ